MTGKFFDEVYGVETAEETRALYDKFSGSYDDEVAEQGYATPARIATALSAQTRDHALPVLDFGCGTGLAGLALTEAGFQTIDGLDLSREMLEGAAARDVYRALAQIDPDVDLRGTAENYAAVVACGVIGSGAAPLTTFDTIFYAMAPGALFAFSFNDHTLEDPAFEERVDLAISDGEARLLSREYGPHLPGLDMGAIVYVIEKA
ncbi:MAG: methyltransferase domain-containing protein [Pseudomonadota bacterium]